MRDRKLTLQMKNIYIILNSKDSKSSGKSRNLIFNRKYKGYSVNDELFIDYYRSFEYSMSLGTVTGLD